MKSLVPPPPPSPQAPLPQAGEGRLFPSPPATLCRLDVNHHAAEAGHVGAEIFFQVNGQVVGLGDGRGHLASTISIASMPDGIHVYNLPAIIDRVYHAIVANSQPPQILLTAQLPAAGWPWLACQGFDSRQDTLDDARA